MMEVNFCLRWKIPFVIFLALSAFLPETSSNRCDGGSSNSVCKDCFSKLICVGGTVPILQVCPDTNTMRCQEMGGVSASCVNETLVPKCKCPDVLPSIIPDAYDNQKYIICTSGGAQIDSCAPGYFDPNTQTCEPTPPTTTTPAPTTPECGDTIEITPVNCTFYQICTPGSSPIVYECLPGYFFNPNTLQCEKYDSFSCSDYTVDNLYPDPYNCSIYHFCSGGYEMGPPLICPEGEVFNPDTTTCVKDDGTVSCLSDC